MGKMPGWMQLRRAWMSADDVMIGAAAVAAELTKMWRVVSPNRAIQA